jgi:hypothetical protein
MRAAASLPSTIRRSCVMSPSGFRTGGRLGPNPPAHQHRTDQPGDGDRDEGPPAQGRTSPQAGATSYRMGRDLRPPTKIVFISFGSPASSTERRRGTSSVYSAFNSMRASIAPRQ